MKNVILFLALFTSTYSLAQERKQPAENSSGFVAILAGPAFVTNGDKDTLFAFGGRIGFSVLKSEPSDGTLGIAAFTSADEDKVSGVTGKSQSTVLTAEYVGRKIGGSGVYLGGRIGIAFLSGETDDGTTTTNFSDTSMAVGPVLGFEAPLGDTSNFVLDLSWVSIAKGEFDVNGTAVPYDPISIINVQAGISFDF